MRTLQKRTSLRERERERRTARRNRRIAQELTRSEALERLIALLEGEAPGEHRHADSRSALARLQAAHAAYALATSSEMKRVADGAWIRQR